MNPTQKASLIDEYNLLFIELANKANKQAYTSFYNQAIVQSTNANKTPRERKKAVNELIINTKPFLRSSYNK